MSRHLKLILPLLLVVASSAHAQGQWTTYLSPKTCNDIIALRDTVWFATGEAGLVRYLRSTNTWSSITREPNGLAGNSIQAITFDRSGNLFAAVPGKGVSRLDTDGRWSLLNTFDGLPSDSALTRRAQGDTIWIGTTRGLALWDGRRIAGSVPDLGTPSPFLDNNINGIAVTGDTLFVSSPKGVQFARLSQRIATWTVINDHLPVTGPLPGQELNVRGLASDGHNVLTLASGVNSDSLAQSVFTSFRWFPPLGRWIPDFPSNSQVRRLRDDFGKILATTVGPNLGGGVFVRSFAGGWAQAAGAPSTNTFDDVKLEVGADPDGVIFASSLGRVLQQPVPPQPPLPWVTRTPPGPVGNNCRNIAWANGSVYACYGNDNDGFSRLRDGVWRNFHAGVTCSLPACDADTTFGNASFPAGLLMDPFGSKWVAMWAGPLVRFDDTVDPPRFRNISFVSASPESVHFHSLGHGAAASLALTPTQQPGVWFGLDSDVIGGDTNPLGLDVYDTSGTFIRNYNTDYPHLRNGLIRALERDRTNQIWVGYNNNGLSTFQAPESLKDDITLEDVTGTGALNVLGIAIHGDSVWVLADDGLHRYNRNDKRQVSLLQIASAPGGSTMHPIAVATDGTVYVGTTGGLRVHRRGQLPVDFTPDNSPLADFEVRGVFVEPSGVVWIGTASGVNRYDPSFAAVVPPRLASLTVSLYPNPAWLTGVGFELHLKGQATSYDGEVYDLNGRMVHRFHAGGNGVVFWNGRDLAQSWVGPGIYFVRVRGGGAETTSRVVVLR